MKNIVFKINISFNSVEVQNNLFKPGFFTTRFNIQKFYMVLALR